MKRENGRENAKVCWISKMRSATPTKKIRGRFRPVYANCQFSSPRLRSQTFFFGHNSSMSIRVVLSGLHK